MGSKTNAKDRYEKQGTKNRLKKDMRGNNRHKNGCKMGKKITGANKQSWKKQKQKMEAK